MARQIVVLFLVFFAVLGLASAAVDRHAASAPAEEPLDNGTDSNVIGTTDGAYNSDEAAPVGGPVPAGAFPNASPAESPKSGATTAEVTSVVGVVAAAVTGDAIKIGEGIGAKTIDLEWVQVHPTGLVKPDDPDAKVKFLAAEALRGVGGIVLDAQGKRFANELGRRDYVTGEMWKNKPPFRLCLNKAASDEIIWHCKHYTGRGVMKFYDNGAALAKDMGISLETLVATHDVHYEAAKKTEKDPDGGSYPAYPSGKSWDEPSGKTGSGKKFYHNALPGSKVATEPFYVAIITPVIHYCMGGLEISALSECVSSKGVIPGLYAAGEIAGGVHGNNRLGGNSLLDCVVFGRVAGKAACEYCFGKGDKFRPCPVPSELKQLLG